jgi:hypothetical protein
VYRLSDESGRLLYVGMGRNPLNRWSAHADLHEWWPQVATFEVAWYDSRGEAAAEERRALREDDPAHNLHGTPKWAGIVSGHVRAELAGRRAHAAQLAQGERTDLPSKDKAEE